MFSQAQCLLWTSLGTSGLLQLIFQHERILPAKQIFFIWDIVVRRWTRNSVQASSVFFPLLPAEPTVRAYSAGELLKFVCHLKIATLHWGKSSKAHKSLHWPILQARFVTWVSFCEERPNVSNLITCSTGGATIQHPLAMCLSSTQITRFGCFSASQIECRIRKIICKFSQESQAHSQTCFASLAEADQSGLPHSGGHHGDRPLRQSSSLLFLIEAIIKQFLSENCLPKIDSQAC